MLRHGAVACEAFGEGDGEDLGEGGVQGVYQLRGWGGEVRGLLRLVVLHYCRRMISILFGGSSCEGKVPYFSKTRNTYLEANF